MDIAIFDINFLVNLVKKMLQRFEEWNIKNTIGRMKYSHIDVTLLRKETKNYTILVTNYGQSAGDVLSFIKCVFSEMVAVDVFLKNALICTVYIKDDCTKEKTVVDLIYIDKQLLLVENTNDRNVVNFTYQRGYLSFLLEGRLASIDVKKFTNLILNEIILLQQLNLYTKYTIHVNKSMIYDNCVPLDNDYKSCQILAAALTNIVKQSLNLNFKKNCSSLIKVENSHEIELSLMRKLLPLIHENYTFLDRN